MKNFIKISIVTGVTAFAVALVMVAPATSFAQWDDYGFSDLSSGCCDGYDYSGGSDYYAYDPYDYSYGNDYYAYDPYDYSGGSDYYAYDPYDYSYGNDYYAYDPYDYSGGSDWYNYDTYDYTGGDDWYNYDTYDYTGGDDWYNYDTYDYTGGDDWYNYDTYDYTGGDDWYNYDTYDYTGGDDWYGDAYDVYYEDEVYDYYTTGGGSYYTGGGYTTGGGAARTYYGGGSNTVKNTTVKNITNKYVYNKEKEYYYNPCDWKDCTPEPTPLYCDSFRASDNVVEKGDKVKLTWNTTGAKTAYITPDVGTVAVDGSAYVTVTKDVTYTLKVTNGKKTDTCTVSIDVKSGTTTKTPKCELTATDTSIEHGDTTKLIWDTTYAENVRLIDDNGTVLLDTAGMSTSEKKDLLDGRLTVKPSKTTTFTLVVKGDRKNVECDVTIGVYAENVVIKHPPVKNKEVVVYQEYQQQPYVSGVYLKDVPYTGYDATEMLTWTFYGLLVLWAGYFAYRFTVRPKAIAPMNK